MRLEYWLSSQGEEHSSLILRQLPKVSSSPPLQLVIGSLEKRAQELIHSIAFARNELCKYRLIAIAIYCDEDVSMEHTIITCSFTPTFIGETLDWLIKAYKRAFAPSEKENLLGIIRNTCTKTG